MDHLFNSEVAVSRLTTASAYGVPTYTYTAVTGMEAVRCRLDIGFLRPGKDQPMPTEAGRAPDRVGVMYCAATADLKPGDRLTPVSGPITGVFEIRVVPDKAIDYSSAHHIEVQVVEVAQQVADYKPAETPEEEEPEEEPE